MERMLISGGNGFLGTFLAEKALENGMQVTIVDDFSTSKDVNVPNEVELTRKRIEDYQADKKFDFVVHLAARPSPEDYTTNPVHTISSNSFGTKVMLDIAKSSNGIFMYTSSSEVYGEASIIPTPETYYGNVNPNGIRSCYDEGKRFSEALSIAYQREFSLDVRIQRPFNVYGPRIREDGFYGRVIPRFITQALENSPITIHGDGSQTRSFLFVKDWLDATWKFLTISDPVERVLNIGSEDQITILDLAKQICSFTESDSILTYLPGREDDPTRRAAQNSLAKKVLNWTPKYQLKEGLNETINWFKKRRVENQ